MMSLATLVLQQASAGGRGSGSGSDSSADVLAFIANILVLVGLLVAYLIYRKQKFDSRMSAVDTASAVIRSVAEGIRPWADPHFSTSYADEAGEKRSQDDYEQVMNFGYMQNFGFLPVPFLASWNYQAKDAWYFAQRLKPRTSPYGESSSSTNSYSSKATSTLLTYPRSSTARLISLAGSL